MIRRVLLVAGALAAALVATAGPVAAHVTVQPPEAEAGGFTKLAFRVPNERDDASTVKIEVNFPEDAPLFSVSTKPMADWTATVERTELDEPVEVFGEPRTDAVTKIIWEGGTVGPGEFQEFEVSVGPLPDGVDQLLFKTLQTYDSGEIVRWIEETPEGGEEPEHPSPVLRLVAGGDDAGEVPAVADAEEADDGTDPVAIVALVVAVAAAAIATYGVVRNRAGHT